MCGNEQNSAAIRKALLSEKKPFWCWMEYTRKPYTFHHAPSHTPCKPEPMHHPFTCHVLFNNQCTFHLYIHVYAMHTLWSDTGMLELSFSCTVAKLQILLHLKWKEKKKSNEWMNEKPQKCTYTSMFQPFFPCLRGPPEVWYHSWTHLSLKYLQ